MDMDEQEFLSHLASALRWRRVYKDLRQETYPSWNGQIPFTDGQLIEAVTARLVHGLEQWHERHYQETFTHLFAVPESGAPYAALLQMALLQRGRFVPAIFPRFGDPLDSQVLRTLASTDARKDGAGLRFALIDSSIDSGASFTEAVLTIKTELPAAEVACFVCVVVNDLNPFEPSPFHRALGSPDRDGVVSLASVSELRHYGSNAFREWQPQRLHGFLRRLSRVPSHPSRSLTPQSE
jgi:hypothetical protein